MTQELFILLVPQGTGRAHSLREEIKRLEREGWRVVSVILDSFDEYHIVAEKETPPGVIFTMPNDATEEELENMKMELLNQYQSGTMLPFIVTGDIEVHPLAGKPLQVFEVTREMMDSWFSVVDHSHDSSVYRQDGWQRLDEAPEV